MIDDTVSELTDGLLNGRISINRLITTLGINPPLQHALINLSQRIGGDQHALEQFKLALTVFLIKSRFVDNDTSMSIRDRLAHYIVMRGVSIGVDESLDLIKHFAMDNVLASPLSAIPVTSIAAFGFEQFRAGDKIKRLSDEIITLISQVEQDCKQKHLLYGLISSNFEKQLAEASEPIERAKIIESWQQYHDNFSDHIQKSVQNIAILSAKSQDIRSQDRLKKVQKLVNIASSGLHFIGPVGSALSGVILGTSSAIGAGSLSYTSNTARYNQMVFANPLLQIENEDDLLTCLEQIRELDAAVIQFTAPVIEFDSKTLKPEIILMHKNEMEQYCKMVCQKIMQSKPPMIACRFPEVALNSPESLPKRMQEDGVGEYLDQLHDFQKKLQTEYLLYTTLARELHRAAPDSNSPMVCNLDEIAQRLHEKVIKIDQQLNQLKSLSHDGSVDLRIKQKIDLIDQYQALTHSQEKTFNQSIAPLKESIYVSYQDGKFNEPTQSPTFQNFAAWQKNNIQSQCGHLGKLLTACEKMGEGRHIANLPALIHDVKGAIKSINNVLTATERTILDEKVEAIVNRSLVIDAARITELIHMNEQNPGLFDAAALRRELLVMREKLRAYPVLNIRISRLQNQVDNAIKNIPDAEIIASLSSLTSLQIKRMHSDTAVVTPSRLEFGSDKQKEQEQSVNAAIDRIFSQDRIHSIQILPLQAINREVWLAARGDEKKLANTLEGLKTEIEWVNTFFMDAAQRRLQTTVDTRIQISNLQALRDHYVAQVSFIQDKMKRRTEMMNDTFDRAYAAHRGADLGDIGNRLAQAGSVATNVIRSSKVFSPFLMNVENQLTRCQEELIKLDTVLEKLQNTPSYEVPVLLHTEKLLVEESRSTQEMTNEDISLSSSPLSPISAIEGSPIHVATEDFHDFKHRVTVLTHPNSAPIKADERGPESNSDIEKPHS